MTHNLMKIAGLALLVAGIAAYSPAPPPPPVPEVNGSLGLHALTLLGGAVLALRSRKR